MMTMHRVRRAALAVTGALLATVAVTVTATVATSPMPAVATAPSAAVTAPLAAGSGLSCAITADAGTIRCWGANSSGQTGRGTSSTTGEAPALVHGATGATAVSAGASHACAILSGAAKCWGLGLNGRLGVGVGVPTTNLPMGVMGLSSGVTDIEAASAHSCAVASGAAWCWGQGGDGRLGSGMARVFLGPVAVVGLTSGVTDIAAGSNHSCAVVSGAAWCWGVNSGGQLGDGGTTSSLVPVAVQGLSSGVTAIAAGSAHSCAVVSGAAWCWGANGGGQLGDGGTTSSLVPVAVQGLSSGVTAISVGVGHSCAIVSGAARCWGTNVDGQLGDGTKTSSLVPIAMYGLSSGVTAIAAGANHSCALTDAGTARCSGNNANRALGAQLDTTRPIPVAGLPADVTAIAAGDSGSCAIVTGGARCWGSQVGDGTTATAHLPAHVTGLSSGVAQISAGSFHTCAVVAGGGARCWGTNAKAQIGDGTTTTARAPADVVGLSSGVTQISAGGQHSCAVVAGAAWCWGDNTYGQVGNGTYDRSSVPQAVTGLSSGVTQIAAGYLNTCAVASGEVWCWGVNNRGQLGADPGTTLESLVPVAVAGLAAEAVAVEVGYDWACALLVSGEVQCWGNNSIGQLGNGATAPWSPPVTPTGLTSGVTALGVGHSHACVVVGGGARCWGAGSYGQLGDGSTTTSTVPVAVAGLSTGVTSASAASAHSCAVVAGVGQCWGSSAGALIGSTSTPLTVDGGAIFYVAPSAEPPTIEASRSPEPNEHGWVKEPVTVSFTCSSTITVTCPDPVTVSTEGANQSVRERATDALGQSTSLTVGGISIDTTAPSLAGTATPAADGAGNHRGPVTVSWTCDDALSGIATGACPADEVVSAAGTHTVTRSVTDRAGNATTETATVRIPPPGISGRVTAGDGTPIAGLQVRAYVVGATASCATTTDADGRYSFPKLKPGDYQVWFRDLRSATWVSEYYDDATTLAESTPLTLAAGGSVTADAVLAAIPPPPRRGIIRGTITSESGEPIAGLQVRLYVADGGSAATTTAADGTYSFPNREQGTYRLWFRDTRNTTWVSEYFEDAATLAEATPVVLGATDVVADATLRSR